MPTDKVKQLIDDPDFIALSGDKQKTRTLMAAIMTLALTLYMVCWAFFPAIVNARIPADSTVSLGIWMTVAIVVFSIALSGYYTLIIGKQHDRLNQKLLGEDES